MGRGFGVVLACALGALTVAACATGKVIDIPGDDAGPTPTADGGGTDACTAMCGGQCVDTKTDANNCGACGKACGTGAKCVQGACQCDMAQTICGGACVDTKTDAKNCGACGTVCGGDAAAPGGGGTWACIGGQCGIACPMGTVECAGSCVDTKTDSQNCGMCGKACTMGQVCTSSLCCAMGQTVCSGACTNTMGDPMNCGVCGKVCSGGTPACSGGQCVAALTYSKMFTQSQVPPAQHCTDWNAFRASLTGTYTSITVRGSNNMVGKTCSGAMANQLCQALRTGTATTLVCGADTWYVGTCSTGIEVSAQGQCTCTSQYAVRPCINHQDWGGVQTTSCNAPSQTLEVVCQ